MELKGKTGKQLEAMRAAKAAELNKIFEDNTAAGSTTPSLTPEQLGEVKS
jgi:hypothetical protein